MGHHIARVGFENSPAFHKRLRIPSICREQEDKIIGQLTTSRLAGDEPSKFRLFLGDPDFIGRIEPRNVVLLHTLVRPYRHREAKTRLAAVPHAPGSFHRGQARSTGRRPAEVWGGHIAHMDCPAAPPLFARVRSLKAFSVVAYRFESILWPDFGLVQTDDAIRSLCVGGGMHWTQ